jgi:hypothetical protein
VDLDHLAIHGDDRTGFPCRYHASDFPVEGLRPEQAATWDDDDTDDDDAPDDAPDACQLCGGPLGLLGTLGNRIHSRCRNYDMDFNRPVTTQE